MTFSDLLYINVKQIGIQIIELLDVSRMFSHCATDFIGEWNAWAKE